MAEDNNEEEKPWKKRLRLLREQHEKALEQQQQPGQQLPLPEGAPSEWEQDFITWYRNTFLVAGAGLVGSIWHWNFGGKSGSVEVFVPPRAQSLPAEVVEGWKRSMRFKEGVRTVGRQSLFVTGVAALYFGAELACRRWRVQDDWANTAAAGAAAGGCLGSLLPGPSRARGVALGAAMGAMLGAASGVAQQQVMGLLPEDLRQQVLQQSGRQSQQQPQQQPKQQQPLDQPP